MYICTLNTYVHTIKNVGISLSQDNGITQKEKGASDTSTYNTYVHGIVPSICMYMDIRMDSTYTLTVVL